MNHFEPKDETIATEKFEEGSRLDYDSITERRTSLKQAGKEWNQLTRQFTSLVLNQAGLQHAQEGRITEAIGLWNEATAAGCAESHYNLAVCYENGTSCRKDLSKVRKKCL